MYTVIRDITPDMANEMLKSNTNNYRKAYYKVVAKYADDMANGRWQTNGDPIRISKSGVLLDGQHRLMAIAKSGTTQTMLIVYDVEDETSVFDIGYRRNLQQIVKHNSLKAGALDNSCLSGVRIILSRDMANTNDVSDAMVLAYVEQNEDLLATATQILRSGNSKQRPGKCGPCASATVWMLKTGERQDTLRRFFTVVNSGFPDETRGVSSAIVLRNKIMEVSKTKYREKRREIFLTTVRAFNDYKAGIPRKMAYSVSGLECQRIADAYYDFCDREIASVSGGSQWTL